MTDCNFICRFLRTAAVKEDNGHFVMANSLSDDLCW